MTIKLGRLFFDNGKSAGFFASTLEGLNLLHFSVGYLGAF